MQKCNKMPRRRRKIFHLIHFNFDLISENCLAPPFYRSPPPFFSKFDRPPPLFLNLKKSQPPPLLKM